MAVLFLSLFLLSMLAMPLSSESQWNQLPAGPWAAREGLMGTFFKGYVWMSGGRYSPPKAKNIQNSVFYNDVWRLDSARCIASNVSNSSACAWELVTSEAPWLGRGYHIMLNHTVNSTDYMYVIGGQNLSTFYNDVWRSVDGENWEQVLANGNSSSQFHVRAGLAAISYPKDGMIYVTGGCFDEFPNRQELNDVWRSKDGAEWQLVTANQKDTTMHVRSGPRIQIYNDILYIVAGEFGFSEFTQLGDVWKLDLLNLDMQNISSNQWQLITADAPFSNRSGHGFVVDSHGTFWVIAGYLNLHDLWKSTDLGATWKEVDREVFGCERGSGRKCGRYDFWAQLDDKDNLFLYGGDSSWNTFGGEHNETFFRNLNAITRHETQETM